MFSLAVRNSKSSQAEMSEEGDHKERTFKGFVPVQPFKQVGGSYPARIQNPGDFDQPARILKTFLVHENADVAK